MRKLTSSSEEIILEPFEQVCQRDNHGYVWSTSYHCHEQRMQIKPIKNVFCVQLLLVYILQSFRQNFGKLVEVRPLLKWDKLRLFVAPHLALVITSFRVALWWVKWIQPLLVLVWQIIRMALILLSLIVLISEQPSFEVPQSYLTDFWDKLLFQELSVINFRLMQVNKEYQKYCEHVAFYS